jgi:hypothetical protein
MKKYLLVFVLLRCSQFFSQTQDSTIKLPFAIANEKRLSDEDLINKKEGTYVTGVPILSSDPINGFGYGGEGSLFFNGKHSDPFFNYTAYRARLDVSLFNTTRNQKEATIKLDVPYIFNTKWRLRLEGGYEKNPNLLYFGTTEQTLNGLTYYPDEDSINNPVTDAKYEDYEKSLVGSNAYYHKYIKEEYVLNVSMERSYLEGKFRVLLGYEIASFNNTGYPGNSLLANDFNQKRIKGVGKGVVSIAQVGLIYDTRDLETDPGQGVFSELTNETSLQALGSPFNFNKTFFHFNFYQNLLRKKFKRLVLAGRVAIGYTAGDSPFYEYQDQWSSEGSIEGLGGANTLRGYKQFRFLSRVMTFNNLELRYRFASTRILNQHLAFSAVPFADAGGVWDSLDRLGDFSNYRFSEGLGLRIAWNVNTIIRFDYAVSKEDKQFFFNLAHTF